MITDDALKKSIADSPLSDEDKKHWLAILDKLNEKQREKLHHSLIAKTNIISAKKAIAKALFVIKQAENEAMEDEKKNKAHEEAKKELSKEENIKNPAVPDPENITSEKLAKQEEENAKRLEELRAELASISQKAHGSPPPSYSTKAPKNINPGASMPQQ